MSGEVEIKRQGRSGWVIYRENSGSLRFEWDINTEGIEVYVPQSDEWSAFCEKQAAEWANDRRQEILERIAQEFCRQEGKKAKATIESRWIFISFEDFWIFSFLKKFLNLH